MQIPQHLITATLAGLAMTLTTSCDKEELVAPASADQTCTDDCKAEGCVAPEKHQIPTNTDGEYYCPPCGMG